MFFFFYFIIQIYKCKGRKLSQFYGSLKIVIDLLTKNTDDNVVAEQSGCLILRVKFIFSPFAQ